MSYCEDMQVNNFGMIACGTNGPMKKAAALEKLEAMCFTNKYLR